MTKWIYQESTGLLTQKQDAALKGPVYTYDELGRMKTRIWARGITSTYGYDVNTGELRTVTYSDSTPAVSIAYDRGGRQKDITDAAGSHTRAFNVAGEMQTEQVTGGILDGVGITVGYDGFLRRNSLQTSHGANTLSSQTYGYDPTSRLETITSGSQTATYAYYPNTGLLNTTTFTGGTNITRSYDGFGRLQNIITTPAADTAQSYAYTYNNLNQRTRMTKEDGSYWSYVYNDRGELISGKKSWSDNVTVWGAQTEYNFDNIGNRNYAKNGGNQLGILRQSNYTSNPLNQYSQRTVPSAVDITGTANPAATVTVNDQSTARKAEYFYKELAIDNTAAPKYAQVNVVGARTNFGAGGEDAVTEKGGRVFVPQVAEAFTYDFDGNLTGDGRWVYVWDAENRLASILAAANVPFEGKLKLEFAYDYMGRRGQKKVYAWDIPTSSYQLQSTTKFVYDGWNLVAEMDGNSSLVRNYVWSAELLLVAGNGNAYQAGQDGNQNVTALVWATTGLVVASYDYDPFGQTLKAVGEYASQNPLRFSAEYADAETGLVYYGYRYYNPQIGRWISQDPVGESGGNNLYRFINNDGANRTDYLGLIEVGQIADVMHNHGWYNGENLLRKWMAAPANSNPDSGIPDTTTIKMDSWVLTFGRAKEVYDKIFSEKVFVNEKAKLRIIDLLKRKGKFGHYWSYEAFDFVSPPTVDIDRDGAFVNERYVGSLMDDPDDMVAALNRFRLRVTIKGAVCGARVVYINEVGVYAMDSYDFNDDPVSKLHPTTWFSQGLGFWNHKTGYVGKLLRGDWVNNVTFQDYRKNTGQGGDFMIYSDQKVVKLPNSEFFLAP